MTDWLSIQQEAVSNIIIGKTLQEAVRLLENEGFTHRIACRDGTHYVLTRDYKHNRANLILQDNIVTETHLG